MAELLQVITAIATILAVLVSLYLANRARRIKKKVLVSEDGIIRIVNVGDSKITISALGYVIDDIFLLITNKNILNHYQNQDNYLIILKHIGIHISQMLFLNLVIV